MYLLFILTNQSHSNMRILPSVSRASGEKQPTGSIFVCKRTTNHHGNSFSPFPTSPGLHQGLKLFSQNIITVHLGYSNVSPLFPFAILHFKRAPLCACVCTLPVLFLGKRWRPVILILHFSWWERISRDPYCCSNCNPLVWQKYRVLWSLSKTRFSSTSGLVWWQFHLALTPQDPHVAPADLWGCHVAHMILTSVEQPE